MRYTLVGEEGAYMTIRVPNMTLSASFQGGFLLRTHISASQNARSEVGRSAMAHKLLFPGVNIVFSVALAFHSGALCTATHKLFPSPRGFRLRRTLWASAREW
ncbi:MAG: hypothetical protein U5K56_00260 [Halioglobus sp.]|nr:hypothetical protein [Halioglobus sp.]